MPSKIQLDECLWFLYICIQNSDMKSINFASVAEVTQLKSPAARMRYSRLKRQIESGELTGVPSPPSRTTGSLQGTPLRNSKSSTLALPSYPFDAASKKSPSGLHSGHRIGKRKKVSERDSKEGNIRLRGPEGKGRTQLHSLMASHSMPNEDQSTEPSLFVSPTRDLEAFPRRTNKVAPGFSPIAAITLPAIDITRESVRQGVEIKIEGREGTKSHGFMAVDSLDEDDIPLAQVRKLRIQHMSPRSTLAISRNLHHNHNHNQQKAQRSNQSHHHPQKRLQQQTLAQLPQNHLYFLPRTRMDFSSRRYGRQQSFQKHENPAPYPIRTITSPDSAPSSEFHHGRSPPSVCSRTPDNRHSNDSFGNHRNDHSNSRTNASRFPQSKALVLDSTQKMTESTRPPTSSTITEAGRIVNR